MIRFECSELMSSETGVCPFAQGQRCLVAWIAYSPFPPLCYQRLTPSCSAPAAPFIVGLARRHQTTSLLATARRATTGMTVTRGNENKNDDDDDNDDDNGNDNDNYNHEVKGDVTGMPNFTHGQRPAAGAKLEAKEEPVDVDMGADALPFVFARLRVRPPGEHGGRGGDDVNVKHKNKLGYGRSGEAKGEDVLQGVGKVESGLVKEEPNSRETGGGASGTLARKVEAKLRVRRPGRPETHREAGHAERTGGGTRRGTRQSRKRKRVQMDSSDDDDDDDGGDGGDEGSDGDYIHAEVKSKTGPRRRPTGRGKDEGKIMGGMGKDKDKDKDKGKVEATTDIEDLDLGARRRSADADYPSEGDIRQALSLLQGHFGWDASKHRPPSPSSPSSPSVLDVLVRTVLSQATTDVLSGRAFRALKGRYATWREVVAGGHAELQGVIRVGGLSESKATTILRVLQAVDDEAKKKKSGEKDVHDDGDDDEGGGDINMEYVRQLDDAAAKRELVRFRGVGEKTAACVLLFGMGRPAFPVDTHVRRVVARLGWSSGGARVSAEDTARQMDGRVPREWGTRLALQVLLIRLGKTVCKAGKVERAARCGECPLAAVCATGRARMARGVDTLHKEGGSA